jgi:hypothetical protein
VTEFIESNPKLGTVLNLDYDKENNVTTVTAKTKRKKVELDEQKQHKTMHHKHPN